jgi:hypothetical protein
VFVSFDDGRRWQALQLNLPVTPVHDLIVKGQDLVAATHGRGFWILDDLTPLRQAVVGADGPVLYAPEPAVRLYYPDQVDSRRPVGQNPPAGAIIDYVLPKGAQGEVTLDILDAEGRLVRHLSSTKTDKQVQPQEWPDQIITSGLISAEAGMNRVVWDLRMNDPVQIPGAFYEDQAPRGAIVPPGTYQVRLTAAGQVRTAALTVFADPRTSGNAAAIAAKTALAVATVSDIDALHRAVNEIRAAEATRADPRLSRLEEALMQVNMKGSEANLAFPGMLNEQYAAFAESLEDADTAPTRQQQALYDSLHARLTAQLQAWRELRPSLASAR